MTYAASDPLYEIVWSPNKDVPFVKPVAVICAKRDTAATDTTPTTMNPTRDSRVMPECIACEENDSGSGGDNMEKMNTSERASTNLPSDDQNENPVNDWDKNAHDQANIGTGENEIYVTEGNRFSAISGQVDQRPFDNLLLRSDDPEPSMKQNHSPDRCSNGGIDTAGIALNTAVTDGPLCANVEPMEKMEPSAEDGLPAFNCEPDSAAVTSRVVVSEIKNKSEDNEMMLQCDKVPPVLHSSCNSRIHMTINKGKEKSLSDGDANVRFSKEENDSYSSVESCNSGGFFASGNKRCNFQQQLIIGGNKRVKKQMEEETSGSKSYFKQDSSFMTWISNMVKGFSKSIQEDDSKTSALPLVANKDHHHHHHHNLPPDDEKLVTWDKNQDPEPKNAGFKSIFQSIYLKNVGGRMSHQEGEVQGIEATPITCCSENKKCLQSNKFEVPTERHDDAGPSSWQPHVKPLIVSNSHGNGRNSPVENKMCTISGVGTKGKEEMATLHSSSSRQNTNNTENIDSNAIISESKEADNNICHKSNNNSLRSLWITRFYPRSTAPFKNERGGGSHIHSTDSSSLLPDGHKHISYLNNCKNEETKEHTTDDTEASTGLKEEKHKVIKPLSSSSPGIRNSEPMASMFARRLGAIKHVIPVGMFCLFCGTRGHQLHDCSHIAESELENLQKNVKMYGGLEDHSCFCINCFQPNHWAISCPASTSARKLELQVNNNASVSDCNEPQAERNLNLKRKSNEIITTTKVGCNASFKRFCGSTSEGGNNKYSENPIISPPPRLPGRLISDIPKGIIDAVKNLRLSRIDILKWINSHVSISELDGFFLRLRLGKWEEGLGGTGYHVASITVAESQRQSLEQNTRKSVSVNVAGLKCIVESQYISNHDFLEDEIMEWWSSTLETGAEIPSEQDLIEKIKRKKLLGL